MRKLYRDARAAGLGDLAAPSPAPLATAGVETGLLLGEEPIEARLGVRNIVIAGRRTSVRLESDTWRALCDIARRHGTSVNDVCTTVARRRRGSLTAALRAFTLRYFVAAAGGLTANVPVKEIGHGGLALNPSVAPYRSPAPRA